MEDALGSSSPAWIRKQTKFQILNSQGLTALAKAPCCFQHLPGMLQVTQDEKLVLFPTSKDPTRPVVPVMMTV